MNVWKNKIKKEIRKILKFYLVGIIALIGNILITYISSDIFLLDFYYSILFIFIFNITFIFYLQRNFTFSVGKKENIFIHFVKFLFLIIVLIFFMEKLVPFINNYVGNYTLSNFIYLIFITVLNYLVQSYLIFKK